MKKAGKKISCARVKHELERVQIKAAKLRKKCPKTDPYCVDHMRKAALEAAKGILLTESGSSTSCMKAGKHLSEAEFQIELATT